MNFEQLSQEEDYGDKPEIRWGNPEKDDNSAEKSLGRDAAEYFDELTARYMARDVNRPQLRDFEDLVSDTRMEKTKAYLEKIKEQHTTRHGEGSRMIEYMVLRMVNDFNLLQPEVDDWVVSAGLASEYDDIRNGVDVMVRFCRLDNGGEVAESFYLGIDTTTSSPETNPDKVNKVFERLGYNASHNQLNTAKFVRDPFENELTTNVEFANVVLAYDVDKLEKLSRSVREKRERLMAESSMGFQSSISKMDLDKGESNAYHNELVVEGMVVEIIGQLSDQLDRHKLAGNTQVVSKLGKMIKVLSAIGTKQEKGATVAAPVGRIGPLPWANDAQA